MTDQARKKAINAIINAFEEKKESELLAEGGSDYNNRLQFGFRELKEFYGCWTLGFGLDPVQLTEEYCEKHNIGARDCLRWKLEGLLFYTHEDAIKELNEIRCTRKEAKDYKHMVSEALDAWRDPEKYYRLSKR